MAIIVPLRHYITDKFRTVNLNNIVKCPLRVWKEQALLVWLLGVLDVSITKYGLAVGAISEGNPIMASLFSFNPNVAIVFSLVVSAFFLACLHYLRAHSLLAQRAMVGLIILRVLIILMHLRWLLRFHFI